MNFANVLWSSKSAALRPRLACEITPTGAVAARFDVDNQNLVSAFAPLPANIAFPGPKAPTFSERSAVISSLRTALDKVSQRGTKMTLVIPDASVRVLLLDFDSLPTKVSEAQPILRFRLRKLVPFEVEGAAMTYQIMSSKGGTVRTIVAVTPAAVLEEYEATVREAGYEPGAVLSSTLAALAAINDDEPALVVNRNGNSVTTAITRQNELLLHRTLDLTGPEAAVEYSQGETEPLQESNLQELDLQGLATREPAMDRLPGEDAGRAVEELQQAVSVAIAYFEDTLAAPPRELLSSGPGGAEELIRLLGDTAMPARDLVPTPVTGGVTSMPRGMLAGVRGALDN